MTPECGSTKSEGLRQQTLEDEYNTEDNDIIGELYRPCLSVAARYDRAVGYFRANIYRELGEDLLNFVVKGGKVRIVCSPDIPEPDEDAAREGYALRGKRPIQEQETSLAGVIESMSKDPREEDCLSMLRLLVERGSLDLFVAMRPGGIYHRKIGMFVDVAGDFVVFSGSGNETWRAVSSIEDWSNDEDFDVFRSWGDEFERKKAVRKSEYLSQLFDGGTKRTKVRPLNEVERAVLSRFRGHADFEDCREGARRRAQEAASDNAVTLRFYQEQAILAWKESNGIGILSMATATGKTVTALFAVAELLREGYPILVLVPTRELFFQWKENIESIYPGTPILLAGAGHDWKSNTTKRMFVSDVKLPRVIISTMSTASTEDFMAFLSQSDEIVLIADEVHRLGSTKHRKILDLKFKAYLGLSATPERLFDKEGSEALERSFGEQPVFNLPMSAKVRLSRDDPREVSIIGHFLCPYFYDFEVVNMTDDELQRWEEITLKVKREVAKNPSAFDKLDSSGGESRLKFLLIERSRIVKNALGKIDVANRIVTEKYPKDGRWIVYCEDENQLNSVTARLRASHPDIPVLIYHSKMPETDRLKAWSYFESNPSIIVSIRCLDEGVDFPAADGAIILASSTNPREYVQRRGRVLRKAKGKKSAVIFDTIVVPPDGLSEKDVPFSIIRSELARAYTFAQDALNPEVTHRLWRVCTSYGVILESDRTLSLQEDESEE